MPTLYDTFKTELKNAYIWPKMTTNAYFGPKILIFMGVSTSFGTQVTENPIGTMFALFLVGHGINGPKMPFLGQISNVLGAS